MESLHLSMVLAHIMSSNAGLKTLLLCTEKHHHSTFKLREKAYESYSILCTLLNMITHKYFFANSW